MVSRILAFGGDAGDAVDIADGDVDGMERTHLKGLTATRDLILAYAG
jgi:hypothetical protein